VNQDEAEAQGRGAVPASDHDDRADHDHNENEAASHQDSFADPDDSHRAPDPDHDDDHHHHDHPHQHGADHAHGLEWLGPLAAWWPFHAHSHAPGAGLADLEGSAEGIRTLRLSLIGLGLTAVIQLAIAMSSGSVGLLADTIHNFSDALTAVPLWLAFLAARRLPTRRYTYGYARAEDVAGVAIVLIILASALLAFWESYQKLLHPRPLQGVVWVMGAALVGFLGNEGVAVFRIRTGRRIGSAALEADGHHARVDGLTSLGVLIGAAAVWLGFPIADPIVGILLSVAILFVTKDAAVAMWQRLLDAVDPQLVARVEQVSASTPGVLGVDDLHLRWVGHRLRAELHALVDGDLPLREAHAIAEDLRHRLFHAVPQLAEVAVHLDPAGSGAATAHQLTAHHQSP
jgi:cation diffusion facilitator family transporter